MRMWFYAGGFIGGATSVLALHGVAVGAPWPYVVFMLVLAGGTFWHSRRTAKELSGAA